MKVNVMTGSGVAETSLKLQLPKVTVVVTCYNYERFIEQALQSIEWQTYPNLECIIVDDCSQDSSAIIISRFIENNCSKKYQLLAHSENTGQLGAMISGVNKATGHFICFLDADDIWAPDFVSAHITAHLNPHYTAGMSSSDMLMLDDDGHILQGTWLQLRKQRDNGSSVANLVQLNPPDPRLLQGEFPSFSANVHKLYLGKQKGIEWYFSPTSACMFRKDLLLLMMPKDGSSFRLSADYYLCMQASAFTDSLIIDCPLAGYRIHSANSFSVNPVVGGDYRPGIWCSNMAKQYNQAIADHITENFDKYANVFGLEKSRWVLNLFKGFNQNPQKGKSFAKLIKSALKRR